MFVKKRCEHNCHLCKKEWLGRCYGIKHYGKDVSLEGISDIPICDEYMYGGSKEHLKEIEDANRKVFLGGTCNGSLWRDELIKKLKINYFNPVVEDWIEECMKEELRQREVCSYCLYTITPRMKGVYSIAEVIDDSNKRPERTIFCLLDYDILPNLYSFDESQLKSLEQVGKMVERNGGKFFRSLDEVASFLNGDK